MAVTCTSDSNVTSATCWLCYTQNQMWGMQMLLLCNAINGDTMDCDPSTILSGATDAGYLKLSPLQQQGAITWLMCQLAANGGGGGGGATQVFAGNYGGGQPTVTPTTSAATAYDTSTGMTWAYYSGAWH